MISVCRVLFSISRSPYVVNQGEIYSVTSRSRWDKDTIWRKRSGWYQDHRSRLATHRVSKMPPIFMGYENVRVAAGYDLLLLAW